MKGEHFWESWSQAGRVRAAAALGRPITGVVPTTNHLESFNRLLKRDHIRRLEKSGRRLRFDVFFHYLISRIIPSIFQHRQLLLAHKEWLDKRLPLHRAAQPQSTAPAVSHPVAWTPNTPLEELSSRQLEGRDIAQLGRILGLRWIDALTIEAQCLSSKVLPIDLQLEPRMYTVRFHTSQFAWCSCPDFKYHSFKAGACKHIYATIEYVKTMRQLPFSCIPSFTIPSTHEEAIGLYLQHQSSIPAELHPVESLASAVNGLQDLIDNSCLPCAKNSPVQPAPDDAELISYADPTDARPVLPSLTVSSSRKFTAAF
jgi:hypothetical protein